MEEIHMKHDGTGPFGKGPMTGRGHGHCKHPHGFKHGHGPHEFHEEILERLDRIEETIQKLA